MIIGESCDAIEVALQTLGAFRVLTSAELNTPIGLIDMSNLERAERNQIAYRKPQTLGELLFNYWD
ncbi:hypothetical protein ACQPZZ_30385 [Microbispora sp. CA-135349]|uniref:hypothetical protein n=1 Tax=Microbispora sp. CA-135349 TaxID=3239953 RepID=UPI003D8F0584